MIRLLTHGLDAICTDDDVLAEPGVLRTPISAAAQEYFARGTFLNVAAGSRSDVSSMMQSVDVDMIELHRAALQDSAISIPGSYGNSGSSSRRTILGLSGQSRDLSFHDDSEYLRVASSNEMIRAPVAATTTRDTRLMGMQMGLASHAFHPPFYSYGRNSDGLTGVLTRIMNIGSTTAILDFCLLHAPERDRPGSREAVPRLLVHPANLVMSLSVSLRPGREVADPANRCVALGESLIEVATLSTEEFKALTHEVWAAPFETYCDALTELLDRYERQPAIWAEDVDAHLLNVQDAMSDPGWLWSPERLGMDAASFQESVHRYGRLLQSWPAMLEYAREELQPRFWGN